MATGWPQKPPLGSQLDRSHPLARDLVGYWLLNEGSGNKANDLTGNGNTGTITGAGWGASDRGPALSMDGTSDYVTVNIAIPENASFTFLCRVNPSTLKDYNYFFDLTTGTGFYTGPAISDNFRFAYLNTAAGSEFRTFTKPTEWAANVWADIVLTVSCSGTNVSCQLYYNGTLRQTLTDPSGFGADTLGALSVNSAYAFVGIYDTAAWYNRALTAAEVAQLYREPFCLIARPRIELWTAVTEEAPTIVPCPYYWHMMAG